jgi:alpha-mannosidase
MKGIGRHHIRYAILPHSGPLDSRTIRTAYNFNHPMRLYSAISSSKAPSSDLFSAITLHGSPSLVLDCIKRGEDDEDVSRGELPKRKGKSVILRIYDSLGGTSRGTIKVGSVLGVKKVWKTNVLEDDEVELGLRHGEVEVEVELRPFEVVTYRLQL